MQGGERMSERYSNKRALHRKGGRFYKPTAADFGIGGACPTCGHILIRVYEGDPNNIDPRAFRYRCFTCEPETDAEKQTREAKGAAEPKFSLANFLDRGAS
jgi:hypothetical protein